MQKGHIAMCLASLETNSGTLIKILLVITKIKHK